MEADGVLVGFNPDGAGEEGTSGTVVEVTNVVLPVGLTGLVVIVDDASPGVAGPGGQSLSQGGVDVSVAGPGGQSVSHGGVDVTVTGVVEVSVTGGQSLSHG